MGPPVKMSRTPMVYTVSLGSSCFSLKQCWSEVPPSSLAQETEVQLNWFSVSL